LITAHVRSIKGMLVTNDARHFMKVPGLEVQYWS